MSAPAPSGRTVSGIVLKLAGLLLSLCLIDAAWRDRESESHRTLALQRELDDKQAVLASHDDYARQLHDMRALLASAMERMPGRLDPAVLDKALRDGATVTSVDIVDAKWSKETAKDFYAELPLDVTVHGSPSQIAAFMNTFLRESPQRTASAMTLAQDHNALRVQMKVLYYHSLDESE